MRLITSLFLVIIGNFANPVWASDWRLDILVFERDGASADRGKGRFQTIEWPAMLAIDNDATVPLQQPVFNVAQAAQQSGITILDNDNSSLRSAARRLNSSGRYRVISEYSVALPRKAITPPMRLHDRQPIRLLARDTRDPLMSSVEYWRSQPDLAPPVDTETLFGWFKLEDRTHAMLSMDLSYIRVMPGVFPVQVAPDGIREYYRDQVVQYRLKTQRKLNPGKLAYFDHPEIGVLARLVSLQNQTATE